MLDYIWTNFNLLPFALRWLLDEWEEKDARRILEVLIKKKSSPCISSISRRKWSESLLRQSIHSFQMKME